MTLTLSGKARMEILDAVRKYCRGKNYMEGQGINNFMPHDCVAAFQMAKYLIESGNFDCFIAIAPEGHIYSYFFELLGAEVQSLFVDYPPTLAKEVDDLLPILGNKRVLLIEDDVISGTTLHLTLETLQRYSPQSISLYLGHMKGVQHLDNVPTGISKTYVAEDYLLPAQSPQYVLDLETYWMSKYRSKGNG